MKQMQRNVENVLGPGESHLVETEYGPVMLKVIDGFWLKMWSVQPLPEGRVHVHQELATLRKPEEVSTRKDLINQVRRAQSYALARS